MDVCYIVTDFSQSEFSKRELLAAATCAEFSQRRIFMHLAEFSSCLEFAECNFATKAVGNVTQ